MNYEKLSDFEINKLIAVKLVPNGCIVINESPRSDSEVVVTTENGEGCTKNSYVDYCNNPSDAWPIIKSNHINIGWAGDEEWFARTVHTAKVFDANPLRAAMIVYLMMKDEEK